MKIIAVARPNAFRSHGGIAVGTNLPEWILCPEDRSEPLSA